MSKSIRTTYDICSDCWYAQWPDQYYPEASRFGTCAVCHYDSTVIRVRKTVIQRGSEALLVYPEGDSDTVTVLSVDRECVVLLREFGNNHKIITTVPEDIGIGVDDTLIGLTDEGEYIS